jgi:hypothetical protein
MNTIATRTVCFLIVNKYVLMFQLNDQLVKTNTDCVKQSKEMVRRPMYLTSRFSADVHRVACWKILHHDGRPTRLLNPFRNARFNSHPESKAICHARRAQRNKTEPWSSYHHPGLNKLIKNICDICRNLL